MRLRCFMLFAISACMAQRASAQVVAFPAKYAKTNIASLQPGDSLVYYQCHMDDASQELITSSGQKITTKSKRLTITEKFVVKHTGGGYALRYYISGFNDFPNKKFAYLTLTEVPTWNFEYKKSAMLSEQDVLLLAVFENKTHEIVHYELIINKSCPNEIVIVSKKNREQLMVEGNYLLSKNLGLFRD